MYKLMIFFFLFICKNFTSLARCSKLEKNNLLKYRDLFIVQDSLQKKKHITTYKKKNPIPLYDITNKIDSYLNTYQKTNQQSMIQGYTIQVYSGNNRQKAIEIKNQLTKLFPHLVSKILYIQPNYTVQIGAFLHKVAMHKTFKKIKKLIPNTIIRSTNIADNIELISYQQYIQTQYNVD